MAGLLRRRSPADPDPDPGYFARLRDTPADPATAAALRTRFNSPPGDFIDATEPGQPVRIVRRALVSLVTERTLDDGVTELVLQNPAGGTVRVTDPDTRDRIIAELLGVPVAAVTPPTSTEDTP